MALGNKRWSGLRRLAAAAAAVAVAIALSVPAGAQYFGDRYPSSRDYYSFPFYSPFKPQAPAEATKPPPPRKVETPPTSTVVVIGDSLADWLAYGLEETYADSPEIGIERKTRPTSGLIRYDAKNDSLEWPDAVKDALAAEKPSAIVVMLGVNDRVPFRDRAPARPGPQRPGDKPAAQPPQNPPPGQGTAASQPKPDTPAQDSEQPPIMANEGQHAGPPGTSEFHTDKWEELYDKRVDDMIAALRSKGVPVLWVGLPAIRGAKSTSDMSYLDEIYRARAERAGVVYVDVWDGFVDDQGRFTMQGPDFEGQNRRLRTYDGVNFTKSGAVKLASYAERELRRVMSTRIAPIALPNLEQTAPKPGSPRPAVGPVLPLTAAGGGEGGDLLGANGRAAPATHDPIASEVFSRGDAVAAPAGRADDFSWPRRGDANAAPDLAPEPAALTPAAPAKKGAVIGNDAKKPADAKDAAKNKPAPQATPPRRSPNASLDGAPRPPAAIGGGF
jgi:hypothetical protein